MKNLEYTKEFKPEFDFRISKKMLPSFFKEGLGVVHFTTLMVIDLKIDSKSFFNHPFP